MNQHELLSDFKLRLSAYRTELNRRRARMAAVSELAGCDDLEARLSARVAEMLETCTGYDHLTDLWESSIMDAGVDYLQRNLHLRPAKVRNTIGRMVYVIDENVRLEGVYRDAHTRLCCHAAGSVGLFGESLAAVVYTWMFVHKLEDPLAPWRFECAERGLYVAGPELGRWSVQFGATRRQTWSFMGINEALRTLDKNPDYSAELDAEGTALVIRKATNP